MHGAETGQNWSQLRTQLGTESTSRSQPPSPRGGFRASQDTSAFTDATQLCAMVRVAKKKTFHAIRSTGPRAPLHNKILQWGSCQSVAYVCWPITLSAGTNPFRIGYRPRTMPAQFIRFSCGSLGIQPRVKSLRSSYTGLYPQTLAPEERGRLACGVHHSPSPGFCFGALVF